MTTVNLLCGGITLLAMLIVAIVDWIRPLANRESKVIAGVVILVSAAAVWIIDAPIGALMSGLAITAQSVWLWYIR